VGLNPPPQSQHNEGVVLEAAMKANQRSQFRRLGTDRN